MKDVAAQKGATEFGMFKNNPGDRDIYIAGPDGVQFRLGTQKASTLVTAMGERSIRLREDNNYSSSSFRSLR